MAAVDGLIRLIAAQNADALLLVSDRVPRLSRAGAAQQLSMPPITAAMMETLVAEVLRPDQVELARAQDSLTVDYGEFVATVKWLGGGWSMAFKVRAAPATLEQPETPAPPRPAARPSKPTPPARVEGGKELLDRWIRRAVLERATDLIVSAGRGARLRGPAGLVDLAGGRLTDAELSAFLEPCLTAAHRAALERHGSADLPLVWRDPESPDVGHRLRVNLFRQWSGLAAVFRPVRRDAPALADLNLPDHLARLARYPNGLVLITGPSGAGKSTTLVALIEQLNRDVPRHVIALEDPIEYEYGPGLALVHQREIGTHVDSFEAGLRAALRESPDIILLGEMRDRATAAAAMTAAETGHLVISSMHAGHAAMAVERVVDLFPEPQQRQIRGQLAGTLRAVLTQHLLPTTRPTMRVPAIELMIVNPATASLIREGRTHQLASAIQTGRDDGMIPLDRSLADLVEAGTVAYETALSLALDGGVQLRDLLGRGRVRPR